jgi:hypothetical protein
MTSLQNVYAFGGADNRRDPAACQIGKEWSPTRILAKELLYFSTCYTLRLGGLCWFSAKMKIRTCPISICDRNQAGGGFVNESAAAAGRPETGRVAGHRTRGHTMPRAVIASDEPRREYPGS